MSETPVEVTFDYPITEGQVVDEFKAEINGEIVEAEIMDRLEALRVYEKASGEKISAIYAERAEES